MVRHPLAFLLLATLVPVTAIAATGVTDFDRLYFQVETLDGEELDSQGADTPFNPASVVKVATSLWALERLGPDHRYVTTAGIRGDLDAKSGRLEGQLVVDSTGDPDFHTDNALISPAPSTTRPALGE
jgi:D-alanyl-D-alanine carboxypeptidase/D-alanyl-D-alanine-endopeptidase (penicillin-binding protein 4)